MKIGDALECAIWLTGTETPEHIARWKEIDCPAALKHRTETEAAIVGPISYVVKRPGQDRVPQVPSHISGPDVRLLVATATVVGVARLDRPTSFLMDLDPRDVRRLRQMTRAAYRKTHPREAELNDSECDLIISRIGPTAAMNAVRAAVEAKALN